MAQIIAQRFPIAGQLGGHLYLAIVDNGELITELHGLAFNPKTGQIKEFGSEDDFILAFRDPPPPNNLYDAEHAQIVLLDGTTADLLTIVDDYLTPMMEYINSYQFRYVLDPPTVGGEFFNSNSVFRAFTEALKIAVPSDTTLSDKITSAFGLGGVNPGTNADILLGNTWLPNLSDPSGLGYILEDTGTTNRLIGGRGNDALIGKDGNDVIIAGAGSDFVYGGDSTNLVSEDLSDGKDTYIARFDKFTVNAPISISVTEFSDRKEVSVFNEGGSIPIELDTLYSIENVFADRLSATNTLSLREGKHLIDVLPTYYEQFKNDFKFNNLILDSATMVADNNTGSETIYANFGHIIGSNSSDDFTINHAKGRTFDGAGDEDKLTLNGDFSFASGNSINVGLSGGGTTTSAATTTAFGDEPSGSATALNIENFAVAEGASGYFVIHEMGSHFANVGNDNVTLSYKNYEQKLTFGLISGEDKQGVIEDASGNQDTFDTFKDSFGNPKTFFSLIGSDNGDTYDANGLGSLPGHLSYAPIFTGSGDDIYFNSTQDPSSPFVSVSERNFIFGGGNDRVEAPDGSFPVIGSGGGKFIMPFGVEASDLTYEFINLSTTTETDPDTGEQSTRFRADALLTVNGLGTITFENMVSYLRPVIQDPLNPPTGFVALPPRIWLQEEDGWSEYDFATTLEAAILNYDSVSSELDTTIQISQTQQRSPLFRSVNFDPGNDTHETYIGTFENDTFDLSVFNGFNRVDTLDGNDTIFGSNSDNIINAGAGDDDIDGKGGSNLLVGGAGDDTYRITNLSAGNDTIRDFDGINELIIASASDPSSFSYTQTGDSLKIDINGLRTVTIEGYFSRPNTIETLQSGGQSLLLSDIVEEHLTVPEEGNEFVVSSFQTVQGTSGDDVFAFIGMSSTGFGVGGNDVFFSNFGGHNIDGGDGSDTLNYAAYFEENFLTADVVIVADDGFGGSFAESFIDGEFRTDTFTNIEKYVTGAGNDSISGTTNDEIFITGDGDDVVFGGGFDDPGSINGGNNLFIDGAGSDQYIGTAGGIDTVSYAELDTDGEGVNVFLGSGGTGERQIVVYDPDDPDADPEIIIETDTLDYIDNVIGTQFNDTLGGGFDGDHVFDGGGGANLYNIAMGGGFHHTIIDGNSASRLFLISSSLFDDRVEDLRVAQDGNDMLVSNIVSGASIRLIDFMITPTIGQLRLREDGQFITITAQDLLTALDTGGIIGGEAPNEAPIAQDDSFTGTEDAVLTGNVLADNGNGADSDADGDTLTVTPATLTTAQGGSVVLLANGDFTYTPAADFNGSDSFSYTVTDGNGGSDTATVTLEIAPVNDAPIAADDVFVMDEDTVLSGNLLVDNGNGADSDVDGDTLSVVAETLVTAQGGTVNILANGDFTYTPAANFNGTDSFSYTLDDGNGGTAVGNVSLTVSPVNDAPLAADDAAVTDEDTAVIVDVLANDSDIENDLLSISAVTDGANGTVTHDGTSVTYTPDADFNGADSFTYTVSDGNGGFDTATVNVTVNPVNDNPVAADDSFTGDEDSVIAGNVLADNGNGADSDVDGDNLSVVAETLVTAQGGTVNILANGDFTYTPAENFNGADSFSYTLDDGNGGTAVGNVSLTVNPVNDAPVANDDAAVTDQDTAVVVDVLANDTDVENDALSVSDASNGANGTVSFDGASVTYTPDTGFSGADSFTYTVSDGNGGFDTATVNVTVNATQTNTPPVANDDDFTVEHGNALTGNLLVDNGNGADSDADNDNLTVTAAAIMTLAGATVTILANGDFTYEGAAGFVGTDSFEYTLEDGNGGFDTAFANITVTAPQGAVVGTEGDDNVVSGSGNDAVFLPGGNNTVSSGSGNDAIYAGSGDDQIASGSGDDIVNITGGNNGVQGGSGNDSVTTGDGDDVIDGGSGNDVIISSGGDNVITGGSGDDFLQTGWGNDLLIGGSGNDWLDGGAGINTLTGGSGADTFVLGTLNAQNTITDFSTGDGDKLHLADLLTGFDPLAHALSDFVQTVQNGSNTHISVDSDGTGTAFAMTEIAVLENTAIDLDDFTAGGHLLIA